MREGQEMESQPRQVKQNEPLVPDGTFGEVAVWVAAA